MERREAIIYTYDQVEAFRLKRKAAGALWADSIAKWVRESGLAKGNPDTWKRENRVPASALAKLAGPTEMSFPAFLAALSDKSQVVKINPPLLERGDLPLIRAKTVQRVADLGARTRFTQHSVEEVRGQTSGAILVEDNSIDLEARRGSHAVIDWADQELVDTKIYLIAVGERFLFRRYEVGPPERWESRSSDPDAHPTLYPGREKIEIVARVVAIVTIP